MADTRFIDGQSRETTGISVSWFEAVSLQEQLQRCTLAEEQKWRNADPSRRERGQDGLYTIPYSMDIFLETVGLAGLISKADFYGIYAGQSVPNLNLARVLAVVAIPDEIMQTNLISPQTIFNSAMAEPRRIDAAIRDEDYFQPLIDFSDEAVDEFYIRRIKALREKAAQGTTEDTTPETIAATLLGRASERAGSSGDDTPSSNEDDITMVPPQVKSALGSAIGKIIIERLSIIANSRARDEPVTQEDIISRIVINSAASRNDTIGSIMAILVDADIALPHDQLEREVTGFINAVTGTSDSSQSEETTQTRDERTIPLSSQALRLLRLSKTGFSQHTLLQSSSPGVALTTYSNWERGTHVSKGNLIAIEIPYFSIPRIQKIFRLSDALTHEFKLLRYPFLDPQALEQLQETDISTPRTLSAAFRIYKGLSITDFGADLSESWRAIREEQGLLTPDCDINDINYGTIGRWESGKRNFIPQRFMAGIALSVFDLPSEYDECIIKFIRLTRPDILKFANADEWLERQITSRNWSALAFPALDDGWLIKQPPEQQAGLLLDAFIQLSGLSGVEFSARTGIDERMTKKYCDGTKAIPSDKTKTIIEVLGLPEAWAKKLREAIQLSNNEIQVIAAGRSIQGAIDSITSGVIRLADAPTYTALPPARANDGEIKR